MPVRIYLVHADGESPVPVQLLSIPEDDVRRLAIRPLKWLRFVMFCVCGARGDLLETPTGPVVNYDSTSLLANASYYYRHNEVLAFIDPDGLNEPATSTARSDRRLSFRGRIIERDGENCVVTGEKKSVCEAAHIIPLKKSDEYLALVVQDRSHCYNETEIFGINAVQNGILLSRNLHKRFSDADVAFLKMPNFALNADDIQFEPADSISADCIILHRLEDARISRDLLRFLAPGTALSKPHVQVMFGGTGHPQPPAVILDFMYGVAAYKHWKSSLRHTAIEKYRRRYVSVLSNPNPPHDSDDQADNRKDGDYEPDYESTSDTEGPCDHENTLVDAMDDMNFLLMYLSGISPEEAAMRKIKRLEEEERPAQEASRRKVTEWVKTINAK